jgi:hypothetical protein
MDFGLKILASADFVEVRRDLIRTFVGDLSPLMDDYLHLTCVLPLTLLQSFTFLSKPFQNGGSVKMEKANFIPTKSEVTSEYLQQPNQIITNF